MSTNMSSSSFSSSNPPNYDVFLSFRGEDTRNNFTSHLYAALCRNNIKTFIDHCVIRKGDEISSSLANAIRSSSLSIIIFSDDYASSSWCLNEVLEIFECNKTRGQIILPIFYHVRSSNIRKQTGTYGEAFAKHEKHLKKMKDKVQKWRAALTHIAGLSGWDINEHDHESESEFIDKIVKNVSSRLNHISSGDHLDGLVGIASRIERVESLLWTGMTDIHIIGIWGMSGIGKTTIARAIFNRIAHQFEAYSFLPNVSDDAKNGPNHLQEKLLFEISEDQNYLSVNAFTLSRLRRRKILMVLDDVNDLEHLKLLMGDHSLFGPGSRIIITSRDMQVLKNGVDELFQLEGLNYHEALQLFSANAFKQNHPPKDYMKLSSKVIHYAKGNPLALKVLGCFLLGRSKLEWKSSLDKLKKYPNMKIQNVLRKSYDGLDDQEKEIFLFIACFFKGEERDHVTSILDGCGFFTEIGISVLVDKCLLTITKNRLLMHDLIQETGRYIVFQQSIKEPGERSRLWDPQDIYNLFTRNTGTDAVESISLDLSQISELYLSQDAFMRMPRLKLLKFYISPYYNWHKEDKVQICGELESLPDELRYLCWHGYPLKSLPLKFNPVHLVEIDLRSSNIEYLWKDRKVLENLRRIGLFKCNKLTEVPDLSQAPNLQIMQLHRCSSLTKFPKLSWNLKEINLSHTGIEEVPDSAMASLNKLASLDIRFNTKLKNLPTSIRQVTSLKSLYLRGCSNITQFPQISDQIIDLSLSGTAIEEVPNSTFESLTKLVSLDIHDNRRLKNLPSFRHLTSLETLYLDGCSNFTEFPEISEKITQLSLSGTAIEEVPSFVERLTNLRFLRLNHCRRLKKVSSGIFQLKLVSSLNLSGCSKLDDLPEVLENKEKLFSLYLERSAIKTLPTSIELLPQLSILVMRDCKNIESLPNSLCNLTNLSKLDLSGCSGVGEMLENMLLSSSSSSGLCSLRDLNLSKCNMLVLPSALSCLSSLDCLCLEGNNFESLSLKPFSSLRSLDIRYCERLKHLQEFPLPSRLEHLDASHCTSLETLPDTNVVSTENWDFSQYFIYYNCLKLNEKAHMNIQADAQLRIQLVANNASVVNRMAWVNFYFPGSEIPDWFDYRNVGSSLTINLPPHWCSNKFFGFVLCIVASYKSSKQGGGIIDCKCSFMDSSDCEWQESTYLLISNSEHPKSDQESTYMLKSKGEHPKSERESTYLFLQSYNLSKYSFCRKVRFHFYPSRDCCKVKKCGVHLVYSEEDENIAKEDHEEDPISESEVNTIYNRTAQGRAKVIAKQNLLVGFAFSLFSFVVLFMFYSLNFYK